LNKDKSWAKVQGNLEEVKDREHSKNVLDVAIMKDFNFLLENFKAKVLGKQGDNILVKLKAESGFEATVYFDAKTYLINQIESTEDTPQGPIPVTTEYSKWEKVGNFLFPSKVKNTNPMFTVELEQNIKLNEEIGEEEFTPSK
ncbi:MAG: hypothetical protein ACK42G_04150, partial [Candidatus Kapaibacteriota bacterium]